MNKFKAKYHSKMIDENGRTLITFSVLPEDTSKALKCINDIKQYKDKGKDILSIEASIWREKRSLDANSYLHVLLNKIAEEINISMDEVKLQMVLDYGTIDRDENGIKVGLKIPSSVDITKYYRYVKKFDERIENDIKFNCFIVYKRTSDLNTKEFSRLLNGVIYEAQQLDIETISPKEKEKMMNLYEQERIK